MRDVMLKRFLFRPTKQLRRRSCPRLSQLWRKQKQHCRLVWLRYIMLMGGRKVQTAVCQKLSQRLLSYSMSEIKKKKCLKILQSFVIPLKQRGHLTKLSVYFNFCTVSGNAVTQWRRKTTTLAQEIPRKNILPFIRC